MGYEGIFHSGKDKGLGRLTSQKVVGGQGPPSGGPGVFGFVFRVLCINASRKSVTGPQRLGPLAPFFGTFGPYVTGTKRTFGAIFWHLWPLCDRYQTHLWRHFLAPLAPESYESPAFADGMEKIHERRLHQGQLFIFCGLSVRDGTKPRFEIRRAHTVLRPWRQDRADIR